jgi:hypothetical protein
VTIGFDDAPRVGRRVGGMLSWPVASHVGRLIPRRKGGENP